MSIHHYFYKNIHYAVSGEGAKTIVFLHGNSLSSETFKFQLEDKALSNLRLIAIEFTGQTLTK